MTLRWDSATVCLPFMVMNLDGTMNGKAGAYSGMDRYEAGRLLSVT